MILSSGQRGPDVCEMAGLEPAQWPDVFEAMVELIAGPKAASQVVGGEVDWDKKFAEMNQRAKRGR